MSKKTKHNFKVVRDPSREYDDYWKVMSFLGKSQLSKYNESPLKIDEDDLIGTDNVIIATVTHFKNVKGESEMEVHLNAEDTSVENRRARGLVRTLCERENIKYDFVEFVEE